MLLNAARRLRAHPAFFIFVFGLIFLLSLERYTGHDAIDGIYFQEWSSSEDMMQTVSIVDLRNEPLQSLYYLHIQPPALDVVRATLAQLWLQADEKLLVTRVDQGLYFLWAVVYSTLVALICRWLSLLTHSGFALCASVFFLFHPALILYSTYLDGTLLCSLGILWSYYELWKLEKQRGSILPFTMSVVMLFFVRSIFQWPVVILYAVSLLFLRISVRKVIIFSVIAGTIMVSYTLKQYYLFGIPSTSSFAGLNCLRGLGDYLEYKDPGAPLPPITSAKVLDRESKITGVANLNNIRYLQYYQELLRECPERLLSKPWHETVLAYLNNLAIYFLPSSRFTTAHIIVNRLPWRSLYDGLFSGSTLVILLGASITWWLARNAKKNLRYGLGMILPASFIFLTSIVFEMGENMRFKFFLEPVFFVFIVSQFYSLWRTIRPRLLRRNPN